MGMGPVPAARKALERAGWKPPTSTCWRSTRPSQRRPARCTEMGWDTSKVNVNGGAIAIGHPIGASGCRILVTLLHEMQQAQCQKGIAACASAAAWASRRPDRALKSRPTQHNSISTGETNGPKARTSPAWHGWHRHRDLPAPAQGRFKVIAGCGPSRDFNKWLGEQKALGYTFHASVGNVGDWDPTVRRLREGQGRARRRRAGQQRRHHARPRVPQDDPRRLGRGDRDQPHQPVQRHQAGGGHGGQGLGPHRQHQLRSTARRARPARPTTPAAKAGMHGSRWRWRRSWPTRA